MLSVILDTNSKVELIPFKHQEIDFVEEKDGAFSAYEFKLKLKGKAHFSKSFTSTYPINEMKTILTENIEQFLL